MFKLRYLSLAFFLVVSSFILSGCNLLNRRNVAGLQVITNDVPVSVFLNDQYLDKSPLIVKDLKPGTYTLEIQPDDATLVPYETQVTLRKGLLTVVTWKPGTTPETSGGVIYELEEIADSSKTEVSVVSLPDGAIISLDQGTKEFAPTLMTELTPGNHEFEASLPSYETQQHTINAVQGHRLHITVKLAKSERNGATPTPAASPAAPTATISATTATPSAQPLRTAVSNPTLTGPTVTIEPTNYFQNGVEGLRVRDQASPAGKEIGFAESSKSYVYLGETENGWYKIQIGTLTGWVSGQYATLSE
ncbi:MAG TPA: PEGA domain-containing protein [Patescibacteria group bacterium]